MTGEDGGAQVDRDAAEKTPFDTSVAHQARMYDYVLGRKIQVVQPSSLRVQHQAAIYPAVARPLPDQRLDDRQADVGVLRSYRANWPLGFFVGVAGAVFFLLGQGVRTLGTTPGTRQPQGGVREPFAVATRLRNTERRTETADETG